MQPTRTALLLIGLFVFGSLDGIYAQCRNKTSVFFGNGVFTQERKARDTTPELRRRFKERFFPLMSDQEFNSLFDFDRYAYNNTGCKTDPPDPGRDRGCIQDLFETFQQAVQQGQIQISHEEFWRLVFDLPLSPDAYSILSAVVLTKTLAYNPLDITEADLQQQVSGYQAVLADSRVIVVSHSQGNFFANQAYERLSSDQQASFGIVSVATPASFVAGDGPYTTLEQDFIHRFPGALMPNASSATCGGELSCHSFLGTYLGEEDTRNIILDEIYNLAVSLPAPRPISLDAIVVVDRYFDRLLIVDPLTGLTRTMMSLSHDNLSGLAYNRVSRLLYSVDLGTNELIEIDLARKSERAVGIVGVPHIWDLTFGPCNELFAMALVANSDRLLVKINVETGAGVSLAPLSSLNSLAYDPDTGMMFSTNNGSLYLINPATGGASHISPAPTGIFYMADQPGITELLVIARDPAGSFNLVGTMNPAAPDFKFLSRPSRELSGIEMVSLEGVNVPANEPPVLRFITPDEDNSGIPHSPYPIQWIDEDPDDNAAIFLYYSSQPMCTDPVLIDFNLVEDNENDTYWWNTSSVDAGQYYILAVIWDGVNSPVRVCSRRTVLVN